MFSSRCLKYCILNTKVPFPVYILESEKVFKYNTNELYLKFRTDICLQMPMLDISCPVFNGTSVSFYKVL